MGWTKYHEDNMEIIYEREAAMQSYRQETEIKVIYTGILPTANMVVEIEEAPVVPQQIEYEDRYIVCKDCGRKFLFSAKAQKHFDKMDWAAPKRCKCCRSYRNTRYLMRSSY